MMKALFFEQESDNRVRCRLCRHMCLISEGKRGVCGVRENRGGTLYSLVYGKICSEQVDPIEKKPLFHVMPGSMSYSIASVGCNFHCLHCQNHTISQVGQNGHIRGEERAASDIVRYAVASGCRSISYTYTEPTINFEFVFDTARLAREAGLKNIFVTNGFISEEALNVVAPFLDAANIDLKAFSEEFYREIAGARLSDVLHSLVAYRSRGIWLEITTLIIPGLNDSDSELQRLTEFIVTNLGNDTPWHVSRYYPTYKMAERSRTPVEILRRACDIGRAAGLRYVYEGNVPGERGENTCCPSCASLLIDRYGYVIGSNRITHGVCPDCGTAIAGIGL